MALVINSCVKFRKKTASSQTKDCTIGMCCFSAKQAALRIKSKDD